MGLISFLSGAFADGFKEEVVRRKEDGDRIWNIPPTGELLYPGELPSFGEINRGRHDDVRALAYAMRYIRTPARPITADDFDAGDFENKGSCCRALLKRGMVRELEKAKVLATVYEKDELKSMLRSRGMPVSGNKPSLAERLAEAGVTAEKGRYRHKMYELTEAGARILESRRQDEREAVREATASIKEGDYYGAVCAYRAYDNDWGFTHASGKKHTIFAHYDIPLTCFSHLARYAMNDLRNTEDFKRTLRACMAAGMMRGCWDKYELAHCFAELCNEPIHCDRLMDYYKYGNFEDSEERYTILARMEENILHDSQSALEYYIAHVLYNIRQLRQQ